MHRVIESELLDDLPVSDLGAIGSRGDLRRLNFLMGHAGIRSRAFDRHQPESPFRSRPLQLVELGAGDGTLLLELARRWSARGVTAQVTLLDRQNLVSTQTLRAFAALNWSVQSFATDVFTWLEQSSASVDVILANLFLHHFEETSLRELLRLAAARTNLFIACEPRRSILALTASRWLGLVGCNAVTRHDAVVSVCAGFVGQEISECWPAETEWALTENPAGLFSHCFVAKRNV